MEQNMIVLNGHQCRCQTAEQYSAVLRLLIADCCVKLCFSKEPNPEIKQRLMKHLIDAYDHRVHRS